MKVDFLDFLPAGLPNIQETATIRTQRRLYYRKTWCEIISMECKRAEHMLTKLSNSIEDQ